MVKKFKIVKCKFCKNFIITSSNSYFKCSICGKNQSIKGKKIFFESENPIDTTNVLKEIKKKLYFQNESIKNDEFIEGNNFK
jgi:hypothetical protein